MKGKNRVAASNRGLPLGKAQWLLKRTPADSQWPSDAHYYRKKAIMYKFFGFFGKPQRLGRIIR
jgi:hypothetical protein